MYVPNQHALLAEAFSKGYSHGDMNTSFFSVTRRFVKENMQLLVEEEIPEHVLLLGLRSSLPKASLSLFVTIPYLNQRIFDAFHNFLPKDVAKLLDYLIWEDRVNHTEIEEKLGIKVYEARNSSYSSYQRVTIKKYFNYFRYVDKNRYSGYKSNFQFYIEPAVRRILAIYYAKPTNSKISPVKAIPDNLVLYNRGEIDIMLELPRVLAYAQQDNIKTASNGKPQVSTLGKMQRKLNLNEFYPDVKEKSLGLMRTNLLAGLVMTMGKGLSTSDLPVLIKTLIQSYYSNKYYTVYHLLTYLKGTGYADAYYLERVEPKFVHLLSELPVNQWVSVENINTYLKFGFVDIRPVKGYVARNKLYYTYDDVVQYERYAYTERKHYIGDDRFNRAITIPTLKGTLLLFAAFGLLDVAYDWVDTSIMGKTCDSPFDGLKYVRLTALGAYVSGQSTTYEPPSEVSESKMELSPDSLTIISDKNDQTAAVVLEPYTEKVTPNRFRTDFSIFLKGIGNKKELNDKIKLFKQSVTEELPDNWQQFFKELDRKIDPINKISNLTIYRIPEDNPDLLQLIARDAKLKNICMKAEGYHILVEKKKLSQFKARLREFGYLMSK
ncbi:MAG: hypothetical protein AAF960_08940 [Bacteroidota bacterium]